MKRRVFHITHYKNLAQIIQANALLSPNRLKALGLATVDSSYSRIQSRRATKAVNCGAGGTLHDYVPWYFCFRCPMLLAINTDANIEAHGYGQSAMVHLVSSVGRVAQRKRPFVFTDGHATVFPSKFYEDLGEVDSLDWDAIKARQWDNTPEFPDRKRRKQAEFLIHDFCPWDAVAGIAVMNQDIEDRVREALREAAHQPPFQVQRGWYY